MANPYKYLKKYHHSNYRDKVYWSENLVYDIKNEELEEAKKIMGGYFPEQLQYFYENIGYARITAPSHRPKDYDFSATNLILPPLVAAHFYQGVFYYNESNFEEPLFFDDMYLANETLEFLEPGDLPFFEIADSSSFMIMKTKSENPNAVWTMTGIKIEDSFERFIWRLYHESPSYYEYIIEGNYAKKN